MRVAEMARAPAQLPLGRVAWPGGDQPDLEVGESVSVVQQPNPEAVEWRRWRREPGHSMGPAGSVG